MTADERRILRALAWMVEQYLTDPKHGDLDSLSMSAGEGALRVLAEHGFVTITDAGGRCGVWTDAGRGLLDERDEEF